MSVKGMGEMRCDGESAKGSCLSNGYGYCGARRDLRASNWTANENAPLAFSSPHLTLIYCITFI